MALSRRQFTGILVTSALVSAPAMAAKDPVYTTLFSNTAVKGYDVTAYFTQGKPVKGSKKFKTTYDGATWLFASQEALDLFAADPEKYAPRFGGYCAYAVSQGATAKGEPTNWSIVDGALYLNYDDSIQAIWSKDTDKYIKDANSNWPDVLNK